MTPWEITRLKAIANELDGMYVTDSPKAEVVLALALAVMVLDEVIDSLQVFEASAWALAVN